MIFYTDFGMLLVNKFIIMFKQKLFEQKIVLTNYALWSVIITFFLLFQDKIIGFFIFSFDLRMVCM